MVQINRLHANRSGGPLSTKPDGLDARAALGAQATDRSVLGQSMDINLATCSARKPHCCYRARAIFALSNRDKAYDLGTLGNGIKSGWSQTSMTLGLSYKF